MDGNTKCHLPIIIMNEFQQNVKATAKMSCSRTYVSKTETSRTGHPCAVPQSAFEQQRTTSIEIRSTPRGSSRRRVSPVKVTKVQRSSAKSHQQPCRTERSKCPFNIVVGEVREKQRTTNNAREWNPLPSLVGWFFPLAIFFRKLTLAHTCICMTGHSRGVLFFLFLFYFSL